MSMPITPSLPGSASEVAKSSTAKAADKPEQALATPAEARTQLNVAIVQSSIEVSLSSGNEPLALLLKSAITGINEALKPTLGDNVIENAMSQDNSPEGTAGRIVSLSTGFFEAFKQQHVGEDPAAVLKNFMETISGGFEKGFNEARDILQGMKVLSDDLSSLINKTYELVQKGYADFEASFASNSADSAAPAASPDSAATSTAAQAVRA